MSLRGLLGLLGAAAAGYGVVALLWPRTARQDRLLALFLGLGAGMGILSLAYFAWGLLAGTAWNVYFLLESAAAAGLLGLALALGWRRGRSLKLPDWRWFAATAVFGAALALVSAFLWRYSQTWQHGGYDGVVIWNMRARFLFFGIGNEFGPPWEPAFSPLLHWKIHADYPLLLPLSVTRLWQAAGSAAQGISGMVSLAFAAGLLGLVYAGLAYRRSVLSGGIGFVLLAGAPLLATAVSGQTADVALAYYFLGACILLERGIAEQKNGFLALAGLFAGLAAWTKNEGQLFLLVLAVVSAFILWRRPHAWLAMLAGAALPLAALAYFKLTLAPPSDLFAGQGAAGWWEKISDPQRYAEIARYLYRAVLYPGLHAIPVLPLLAGLWLLLREQMAEQERRAWVMTALVAGITWAGYILVYLITPHDLEWHLQTSIDRLVLQWLPAALYIMLGSMRSPEKAIREGITVLRRVK